MDTIVQQIVETSTRLTELCAQYDQQTKGYVKPFEFDGCTINTVKRSDNPEELGNTLQHVLDSNRVRESALAKVATANLTAEERRALFLP